jgi:hypothetical protein
MFGGGDGRGAEGEKRRGRVGGAGEKFHSGCASPAKARAREEAPKLPRRIAQNAAPRYLFPARETIQPLLEENTARTGGKKSIILALRYFNAAAGDALRDVAGRNTGNIIDLGCPTPTSSEHCGSNPYTKLLKHGRLLHALEQNSTLKSKKLVAR